MTVDAEEAVGSGQKDDYVLSPAKHATELEASAPELARLLSGSRFQQLADQYEEADAVAVAAQQRFRTWVSRANWSVLATATFSALLMGVGLMKTLLSGVTQPLLASIHRWAGR